MDRDTRICIVGAGAAGLAAAHFLAKGGFRRVTVLEKDDRVGGKCCTIEHGGRTYELGAVGHTLGNNTIDGIMRDIEVSTTRVWNLSHVDFERGTCRKPLFYWPMRYWLSAAPRLFVLVNELRKHRRILRPGFAGIDPELAQPFAGWAARRHLGMLAVIWSVICQCFGYGYSEEVAAAYILKTILTAGRLPWRVFLDVGYSGFWEQVASRLDVRPSCPALAITRGETVSVHTRAGTLEFDVLILACPLDDSLAFIDGSFEEHALFSKIRYYDYHVLVAFATDLPDARVAYVPFAPPGRTMAWYRRWLDRELCTFYALGRSSVGMSQPMDHEQMRANIEEDVARLGIKITGYHAERVWKYFPHVSPEDFGGGYYERLESLQGQNKTYYTGELLNFATVETVAAYSRDLVDRYFLRS